MAGVSDIIAYGFGSWSTVAKVPTLGFGIGTVAVTSSPVIRRAVAATATPVRTAVPSTENPIRTGVATTETSIRRSP